MERDVIIGHTALFERAIDDDRRAAGNLWSINFGIAPCDPDFIESVVPRPARVDEAETGQVIQSYVIDHVSGSRVGRDGPWRHIREKVEAMAKQRLVNDMT